MQRLGRAQSLNEVLIWGENVMKRIAILGCENSHANNFLKYIKDNPSLADVEVIGVYSDEEEEVKILCDTYGVYAMKSYDEFVGKVDGVIVTARHGDNHYKYAKPYIESGVPMFIDKPITCSEEDAAAFLQELKNVEN
jgi:predicted dehydrogenase